MKSLLITASILLSSSLLAAEQGSTVKLAIATQTYKCTIANQNLSCAAANEIQKKVIDLNKNGGKVQIADAARGLSLDLSASLADGNVNYDLTLCSNTVCTINDVYSNSQGSISQIMLGQYNLTESSFYVLGVSISSTNGIVDFRNAINKLKRP